MYTKIEHYQGQRIDFERELRSLLAEHDPFQITRYKYSVKDLDDANKTAELVARAVLIRAIIRDELDGDDPTNCIPYNDLREQAVEILRQREATNAS